MRSNKGPIERKEASKQEKGAGTEGDREGLERRKEKTEERRQGQGAGAQKLDKSFAELFL